MILNLVIISHLLIWRDPEFLNMCGYCSTYPCKTWVVCIPLSEVIQTYRKELRLTRCLLVSIRLIVENGT